ncbi:MAG: hypothetical protein K2G27_00210 [Duncaniella sp.]|nr:hypothetical protein [Duncaniella sp.]
MKKVELGNTLKDRISAFIKRRGIKRAVFERNSGLSNGYTNNIKENIGSKKLEGILLAYPEINRVWLITGEGDMLIQESEPQANAEFLGRAVEANREATVPVRFYEPSPTATFQEFCAGVNEAPESINILPEPFDNIDESSCVFRVSGDSMSPQIQDKAKILCREVNPSRWHYINQGVIAIVYDDRFVIKRVKKNYLDTDNYILLCSDNPDYPDTEKAYLGSIRCIYEVIRVISQRVY